MSTFHVNHQNCSSKNYAILHPPAACREWKEYCSYWMHTHIPLMLVLALDLAVSTKFSTVLYISKCSQEENQGLSTLEEIITFHTPLLCHPSPAYARNRHHRPRQFAFGRSCFRNPIHTVITAKTTKKWPSVLAFSRDFWKFRFNSKSSFMLESGEMLSKFGKFAVAVVCRCN